MTTTTVGQSDCHRVLATGQLPKGDLPLLQAFENGLEALHERFLQARKYADNADLEIVVLGADTLADARRTHQQYFRSVSEIATEGSEMVRRGVETGERRRWGRRSVTA